MWLKGMGTTKWANGKGTFTHTQEAFSLEEAKSLAGLYARIKATQRANHEAFGAAYLAGAEHLSGPGSRHCSGYDVKACTILRVIGDPVERAHDNNYYCHTDVEDEIERQVEGMTSEVQRVRWFAAKMEAQAQAELRAKEQAKVPVKAPGKASTKNQVPVRAKAPVQAPVKGPAPLPAPSSTRKHARDEDEEEDEPLVRRRRT
ncbi:hypothetical protein BGX34_007978, partial [Mortierella sp. NVP85]